MRVFQDTTIRRHACRSANGCLPLAASAPSSTHAHGGRKIVGTGIDVVGNSGCATARCSLNWCRLSRSLTRQSLVGDGRRRGGEPGRGIVGRFRGQRGSPGDQLPHCRCSSRARASDRRSIALMENRPCPTGRTLTAPIPGPAALSRNGSGFGWQHL